MEIGAGDAGFDAPEAVVGAECEHEDSDGLAENPIDAARATGGRFPAQSGIDDAPRGWGGLDFLPDEGGVGFSSGVVQTVARSEAIPEEIKQLLHTHHIQSKGRLSLMTQYPHGGYAKWSSELIEFIHWFWESFGIPLDPIYTGKMAFACWDLLQKKYFKPGSRVLLIHTGGLQGNLGFTQRTGIKLPSP